MEGPGEIWEFEGYYRPGQPSAGMRPEPLVWLIHVSPLLRAGSGGVLLRGGWSGETPDLRFLGCPKSARRVRDRVAPHLTPIRLDP